MALSSEGARRAKDRKSRVNPSLSVDIATAVADSFAGFLYTIPMQSLTKRLTIGITAVALASLLLYAQFNLQNMEAWVRWRFADVPQLSTAELASWLADSKRNAPILLDVRRPEEFQVSHLVGAVRVDEDVDIASLMSEYPADQALVLYCAVGYRSSKLAKKLIASGRNNVWSLKGSIFAWAQENRALESKGKPTTDVHPANAF